MFQGQTMHIDIQYHVVEELIANEKAKSEFCTLVDKCADHSTKIL